MSRSISRILKTTLFALAVAASQGLAQSNNPTAWLDDLKEQISRKEICSVNYFQHVKEYQLGGSTVYEARVYCLDGRQFDATRTGDVAVFTWQACQPQVC